MNPFDKINRKRKEAIQRETVNKPIVLAKPAFKIAAGNSKGSSCVSFYARLKTRGLTIIEWNPYKMLFGKYDILHLHWPDNILNNRFAIVVFLKLICFFAALAFIKARRKIIVWTAHNLESHEKKHPFLEAVYWNVFGSQVDGIITPLKIIREKILADKKFSRVQEVCFLPFGDWSDFFVLNSKIQNGFDQRGVIRKNKIALYFGLVRRYKGVDELIRLFSEPALRDVTLWAFGMCFDNEYKKQLEQLAAHTANVRLRLAFIPDQEVPAIFNMADICIFPFRDVTNTGSVRLALTFHRHVVVPDLPFAAELKDVLGEKWFTVYPQGRLSAEHICLGLHAAEKLKGQTVCWGDYNWDKTSERAEDFFIRLIEQKRAIPKVCENANREYGG